ncbi:Tas Predicted oxidoreductases (related to aryl-alcohol dehydrogenases) [Candidatus Planktophila dulcis]|uniref:aldo/keto reductase n=1 Tax=Candidatus Planktophila dulcis TaxID=1884914 RepID=UPI003BEEE41B
MLTIPETDLVVHPLCLGGNVFGWTADEKQSHDVLNAYASHGGNFIDTADVYSEWKPGNMGGESETIIGTWLKSQDRSKFVIATKVAKLSTRPGLRPENIIAACNDSLKRIQTDYIDIYYSHHDDAEVPMAEILGAYAQLISEGKVRHIAASQHTGARLQEALNISKEEGLPQYIALQDHYNLMERNPFESEQQEVLAANNISALPFYSLARGFLSGKYRPGVTVDSVRADGVKEYQTEKGWAVVAALDEIAKAHNSSVSAIALAWLRSNPQVSTPIASARTVEQLIEIIEVIQLSVEEISLLSSKSR